MLLSADTMNIWSLSLIFKIQESRHAVLGENDSYQKWKAYGMGDIRKKFYAFVQNVHIQLLSFPANSRLSKFVCF